MKKIAPQTEVILLTGHASMDTAVEAMRLGGYDYLLKPCPVEDLLAKIESATNGRAPGRGSRVSGSC